MALTTIDPQAYASWRGKPLGAITEAIELRQILDLMGNLAGARVLDVGCGDGLLACVAAARGAAVTGIDPDPAMLAAARRRAAGAGLELNLRYGTITHLPFPDGSFDIVTAITVLCFVPEAGAAFREMARMLRPGGRLVLGELGRWSLWAALRRLRGWLGSTTWQHAQFRTAAELRLLARNAGLAVTAVRGAVFYPPVGLLARAMAPIDPWLGQRTTFGAAFIGFSAMAPTNGPMVQS